MTNEQKNGEIDLLPSIFKSSEQLLNLPHYEVLSSSEGFLTDLEYEIRHAESSLDLQFYVFEGDNVGQRVGSNIRDASQRGVRSRLAVDHFIDLSHNDQY